jgi:hypothetical protein
MYIDIDIHHGDGVEQAFYQSNRVMTVSFHKYNGEFFPSTGKLDDNGMGMGKHFAVNVPLQDGITDDMYLEVFRCVIEDTVTHFKPSAIVLQCGADSLGCDRLGAFNLSIAAHGACVNHVRQYNVPLLVLGGGGYTIKNVSRCWTYETAVLVGAELPDELPRTVYDSFFRDSHWKLHPPLTGRVDNMNTEASLRRITTSIRSKLRYLQGAPSVQMSELPPDLAAWLEAETGEKDREEDRMGNERRPDRSTARNEHYEGENDVDQDDVASSKQRGGPGRRPRGGRRTRGRGRAKPVSTATREDGGDAEAGSSTSAGRSRGRGRARGRGRGRGKSTTASEKAEGAAEDVTVEEPRLTADSTAQLGEPLLPSSQHVFDD